MQRDRFGYLAALGALLLVPALTCGIGPVLGNWIDRAGALEQSRPAQSSRSPAPETASVTRGTTPTLVALARVEGRTFRILVGRDGFGQTWSAAFTTED